MTRRNKDLGDWGESQACGFLERHGFEIIERNFFTTVGEIDIVARKGDDYYLRRGREDSKLACFPEPRSKYGDLYFVEVKTRRGRELATDAAITPLKKYRFFKTINQYCYRRGIANVGLIAAGIIVGVDKIRRSVRFRLAVWN